jgi:hypothetical protein
MTLTTASITLAGLTLDGAKDDKGNYYVLVPALEMTLGWRRDQAREKLASKSLEAFAGKSIRLGKKKDSRGASRGYVSLISTQEFMTLVGWESSKGNKNALALLVACAQEALERRIDHALGVVVPEETREERTDNSRELARKTFQPELTEWLKYDENTYGTPTNYARAVNQLKKAAKLPLVTVDEYTDEQNSKWYNSLVTYGAYRELGMNHKLALQKVTLKFDKP